MHLDCYAVFVQSCKKSSLELIIFEINRKLADGISWRSQYIRELPMGYGKSLIFQYLPVHDNNNNFFYYLSWKTKSVCIIKKLSIRNQILRFNTIIIAANDLVIFSSKHSIELQIYQLLIDCSLKISDSQLRRVRRTVFILSVEINLFLAQRVLRDRF